ncbi:hypothetical protein G6011_10086 [Alternaria panax]|uniref:Uncharacterized protein n=1 Tax=Alternaria panax TaxID=48097 RepID=A0AAD4FDS6_9PLEO|nr:hypothetical protein G6011_10086 [Alternaria panax]
MPLVVPGLQSKDGNSGDDWSSKLMGKKLGDQHDEVVSPVRQSPPFLFPPHTSTLHVPTTFCTAQTSALMHRHTQTFAKTDLPQQHRVLKPDTMKTMDFKPDRLNVHVDEDGTVKDVTKG